MKDSTRARVAAAVSAAIKKKKVSSVFDYQSGKHRRASADVSKGKVTGFDYDSSSHFSGGGSGKLDFFDYDTSSHVQLKLEGRKFSGFDYNTNSHFSGSVSGNSISLYDYETGQYYNYSV
jgi:hypothetical protein